MKRAIARMQRSKTPRVVKADVLLPRTPVYYYVRGNKQGEWKLGCVWKADEHIVSITTKSDDRGHKMAIAYEDIRLVPSSALLYETATGGVRTAPKSPQAIGQFRWMLITPRTPALSRPLQNLNHVPKHLYGVTTHCKGP